MRAAGTIGGTARHQLPRTGDQKPPGQLDEQRGRRNFLTWAFVLAQASAAELLLTGATKAQDDELAQNLVNRSDLQSDALPNDVLQRKFDVAQAEIVAPPSSSVIAQNVAPDADTSALSQPPPLSANTKHTPPAGSSAGTAGSQGPIGSSGSTNNSLPTLLPDIGVTEQTPPPPITVDIGLTPLLGFDVTIDVGGLISANVGLDLNNLLVGPLQGVTNLLVDPLQDVTGLVGSLTADLGNLLNGDVLGLGELLQSSPVNLGELTGLTLIDDLAGLLGQAGGRAPAVAQLVSDAANPEPVLAAITNAGEFSALDLFGGSGVINILGGAIDTSAQLDVLYAQGSHTEYNIALHHNAEAGTGDAAPDIAAVAEPTSVDQPPADIAIAEPLPLDELLTRPLI